jgi:hypothetical protein
MQKRSGSGPTTYSYQSSEAPSSEQEKKEGVFFDVPEFSSSSDESSLSSEGEALKYLSNVRKQVKQGPRRVAVESTSSSRSLETAKKMHPDVKIFERFKKPEDLKPDDPRIAKKVEIFRILRSQTQLRRNQTKQLRSPSLDDPFEIDDLSVISSLNRSLVTGEEDGKLFNLLLALSEPIHEETACTLQKLRKSLLQKDSEISRVLVAVISEIFNQK